MNAPNERKRISIQREGGGLVSVSRNFQEGVKRVFNFFFLSYFLFKHTRFG
jgi:hypothetical protein